MENQEQEIVPNIFTSKEPSGYPNYLVETDGRIYSKKKKKWLKLDKYGYYTVISSTGKSKKFLLKDIVRLAHIPMSLFVITNRIKKGRRK